MTTHQIRRDLEAKLHSLLARKSRIEGDLSDREMPQDWEEQAQVTEDDEVLEGLDGRTRDEISAVRMALVRMDEGSWSTCSNCGDDIEPRRLEALPTTTLCRDCAETLV